MAALEVLKKRQISNEKAEVIEEKKSLNGGCDCCDCADCSCDCVN